nr:Ycf37 protein [Pyropia sp. Myanmar_A]BED43294.1 Ycf37 protein [Pyropia sp. Myanmar_B]BED43491.1 Ycf37 protein [Pyropia sp. Myanmar_C]
MTLILPLFYLSILTLFLLILNWLIGRQIKMILALESQFKYFCGKSQNGILELEEHFAFAKVCVAKKSFSKAIIEIQLVLKKNPDLDMLDNNTIIPNLYNMLGFIYSKAGQVNFAKNFYKQALQIDPNYVVALNNLAKIYEDKKDFKQAEFLYDRVLTLQLNNKIASRRKNFITQMKKM